MAKKISDKLNNAEINEIIAAMQTMIKAPKSDFSRNTMEKDTLHVSEHVRAPGEDTFITHFRIAKRKSFITKAVRFEVSYSTFGEDFNFTVKADNTDAFSSMQGIYDIITARLEQQEHNNAISRVRKKVASKQQ